MSKYTPLAYFQPLCGTFSVHREILTPYVNRALKRLKTARLHLRCLSQLSHHQKVFSSLQFSQSHVM